MSKAKDRREFVAKAKALLAELGAVPGDFYPLSLNTKAGRLWVKINDNCAVLLGTVFTRFDDPERAKQIVDCNPYSGKWNFHYTASTTVADAMQNLTYNLRSVL